MIVSVVLIFHVPFTRKEQERLNQQARIDALTQDGNRYYFKDEIQKILD